MRNCRLFLLDMDGTLYLDDRLFPGVAELLAHIRAVGGRYIFLTNNSSKGVEKYIEKLAALGIPSEAEDFLTSTHATAAHLQQKHYRKIYAFGTDSFRQQLREAGLPITERAEPEVDCLCMGFDTQLSFQKLEDACILLGRGVDYVATNPDWVCPTWYGYVPDCGSVSEMLYRATNRRPLFIGKPEKAMVELAMARTGFSREETVLIGDRLYTDIACAKNAEIHSVLVLSGESTLTDAEASPAKPDLICKDIREFLTMIS